MKKFYARTNKNCYIRQITRLERRERALEQRRKKIETLRQKSKRQKQSQLHSVSLFFEESEILGETPPDVHHHISHSRNFPIPLYQWMQDDESDIALKVEHRTLLSIPTNIFSRTFFQSSKHISCTAYEVLEWQFRNSLVTSSHGARGRRSSSRGIASFDTR